MKKITIILIGIIVIILLFFSYKYINFRVEYGLIKENNKEYEYYFDKLIYGTDIATLINKAIDSNEKNHIEKDENGLYIEDGVNSIKIQIQITDNDTLYDMETIYNGEITRFVENYNSINFKCTKLEYNKSGKIGYILFEQQSL